MTDRGRQIITQAIFAPFTHEQAGKVDALFIDESIEREEEGAQAWFFDAVPRITSGKFPYMSF